MITTEHTDDITTIVRLHVLHALAALVRRDHERLATIAMLQTGKTWAQAFGDVDDCAIAPHESIL